ncbi:MAG: NAD(+) synthase [Deltaproteobacteria bacterium HGW-Deltaproteobacteria-20]|jgi:NAD+ synthase|nr:MAG: NAD(+) synthase [Deltaproteobacteria bacterium HGW-Deltaproteobacteria-20]
MTQLQQEIARALHVQPAIDPETTLREIVTFLSSYLFTSGAKGYVLGISGGQDSSLCGKLAQLAVSQARAESGKQLTFWAVRLPHGLQKDEDDAQLALAFIEPDRTVTVDIQPAVAASAQAIERGTGEPLSDYHRGNIKARERMVVQYALAGAHGLLVLGTDHAAEAVTGFFTKHGDGACDLAPLTGLTKRQGKLLLQALHAPARLYEKTPTADLEDLKPLVPDETALGLTYEQIDDYLEGRFLEQAAVRRLEGLYLTTQHKRSLPVTRFG